ncbi:MAG: hypothetical protein H7Y13_11280 [Sphingobacteriaceae bacterium]|nr:hypothetical protein [Sphingobacteriaceae bacterium]
MKIAFGLIAGASLLSVACIREPERPLYTEYRPVLLSRESLEKSITLQSPAKIKSPAKIYFKDNFIFISEQFKGVHIIDNADPKNPVNKGYIGVPGCVDMAIKDDVLYVDNATDLVAVDLSSLSSNQISVSKRIKNAFPELSTPDGRMVPDKYSLESRPKNTVLVEWIK